MNNRIYYHIWAQDSSESWVLLVDEQLKRIWRSGCLSTCDVKCVITGDQSGKIEKLVSLYEWVEILECTNDQSEFEGATLKHLYNDCVESNVSNVMYMHTKGISNMTSYPERVRAVNSWRHMMEWACIDRWEENIRSLELEGYDISGVNWQPNPWPHFSGNFWWASSDYISSLKYPVDKNDDRYQYERWIGTNNPSVKNIYEPDKGLWLYRDDIYPKYLNTNG